MPLPPPAGRTRLYFTALAILALAWTGYAIYAWQTQSGAWLLTFKIIAKLDDRVPESESIALMTWAVGLGGVVLLGWPVLRHFWSRR